MARRPWWVDIADNSQQGAAWVFMVAATDATLSNLAISSGSLNPAFSSTQLIYGFTVPKGLTAKTITQTTNDPNATATVNGQTPATAVSLTVGVTAIPVVVTAQDGITKITYTVNVTRQNSIVSINTNSANPNPGPSVIYTVAFSDPVQGLDAGDFSLTATGTAQGTVTGAIFSGSTATVTVTGVSGDGNLTLNYATNESYAGVSNTLPFVGQTYAIDNTPPTVNSITALGSNPNNASSDQFSVTFSEAVSGVDVSDFTLTNTGKVFGTIASVAGSGTTYTVTVNNVTGNGTMRLDLNNSGTGIQDLAGNAISTGFTGGDTYTIDQTAPAVNSITATAPSNANPTNATSVTYTVTFGEAVTGVDASDFTVTASGTTGAVTNVTGSGASYTVTVGGISGNGTLRLDLNSSGTGIQDLAGNAITTGFTGGDTYTIIQTPPAVSSITALSPSNANPTNATSVIYNVTFSEAVTGVEASDFTVSGSGTSGSVIGVIGDGALYKVTVGGISGNGTLRLDLNSSGTGIQDLAGNAISGGFTSGDTYTIDNTPPTIAIGSPSVSSIADGAGSVTYSVTYSDADFNASTLSPADITLNSTGTAAGSISVDNGTSTNRMVTISSITGTGTIGISIAAGTASDLAGNLAPASGASAIFNVVTPTISTTGTPSALSTTSGTASSSTSFKISGTNMEAGILVTSCQRVLK